MPLNKRNKLTIDGVEPDGANWKESRQKGALLTSTAIMQLRAKRDQEIDGLLQDFTHHLSVIATSEDSAKPDAAAAVKMLGYTACWAEEVSRVTALAGSGSGFQQQGSGIDAVFSSYFWLYKMGCKNYHLFEEVNGLLVGISEPPREGKNNKSAGRNGHSCVQVTCSDDVQKYRSASPTLRAQLQ